ncbi:type II secretion system GspH family protein [bacterium]|nr:type II secretion system GspH family protein [bacterium]
MIRRSKGMSIIEVMISIGILLAFSIPIIGLASLSKASSKRNTAKTHALLIAQSYIDEVRYSINKYGRATRLYPMKIPKKFKVKNMFSVYGSLDGLVKYSVTVTYKQFRKDKQFIIYSNNIISFVFL